MKRIDIFCASQASTAICHSMDQASCSSSNAIQLGGRTIDRHNPIINDSRRSTSRAPCSSSQPPIDPKPYQKTKIKNSSSKPNGQNKINATKVHEQKNKSTAEKLTEHVANSYSSKPIDSNLRRSWHKPPVDSITPPGSTRSLLSDTAFLDGSSDNGPVLALTTVDNKRSQVVLQDETNPAFKPSSSSCPKSGSSDQVVVLKVSLHCKGCEGKVRKHLSRMQGVTSFNIDFAAKKVTVVGDVTPLSVLASISKVKNAQLWPASASAVGSGTIETKKQNSCN
ncbi:Heavy metal-associated domain, HMA [Sesbania bispinosa]|nr:Heavy metal-associated domain, HMA [Sesbania bispinosa]